MEKRTQNGMIIYYFYDNGNYIDPVMKIGCSPRSRRWIIRLPNLPFQGKGTTKFSETPLTAVAEGLELYYGLSKDTKELLV